MTHLGMCDRIDDESIISVDVYEMRHRLSALNGPAAFEV